MKQRTLAGVLIGTCALAMVAVSSTPLTRAATRPDASNQEAAPPARETRGLELRLSEGKADIAQPSPRTSSPNPAARLADREAARLLSRVAPPPDGGKVAPGFVVPTKSRRPPRTGAETRTTFPPSNGAAGPAAAPTVTELKVLRYQPEGEVRLAPKVSVTFSEPMVALSSQEDMAKVQPVILFPQPKGRWRWLGARTIVFEPEGRMPQATIYRVEIPAGTRSALGHALKEPVTFSFSTPPPTIVEKWPESGPHRRDALMWVKFDQAIDPAAVLKMVAVEGGTTPLPIRLATADEIDRSGEIKPRMARAAERAEAGRWLVFRTIEPMPANSTMTVTVNTRTPSAEGPRGTELPASWSFWTHGPLRMVSSYCGPVGEVCDWPNSIFTMEFTNPLDKDSASRSGIRIVPTIPDMTISVYDKSLDISGAVKPRTTYTVTLPPGLADQYGQTLDTQQILSFKTQAAGQAMVAPRGFVVADPTSRLPLIDVQTMNAPQIRVQLYSVSLADVPAFVTYQRQGDDSLRSGAIGSGARLPGKKVYDRVLPIAATTDQPSVTSIDLTPALAGLPFGHVILSVEMPVPGQPSASDIAVSWIQVTKLAVDVQVDETNLVASTTDLRSGRPLAGVELELRPVNGRAVSDASGFATLALPSGPAQAPYLVARRGADTAFIRPDRWSRGDSETEWTRRPTPDQLAWYVTTDRNLYRKGEEVRLKGWVRVINPRLNGDVESVKGRVERLDYVVRDSRGAEMAAGTAELSELGGWDARFRVPDNANLGGASITLSAHGWPDPKERSHQHWFKIEEFRRPEFEVTTVSGQGLHFAVGTADLTVTAKYFAGGVLPGAPVSWRVSQEMAAFAPPNWDHFVFGGVIEDRSHDSHEDASAAPQSLLGQTDDRGTHTLHVEFPGARPARPVALTAQATVTDTNRQAWTSTSTLLVHPSKVYVGVRAPYWGIAETPFRLELIAVDLDGKPLAGRPITVRASRAPGESGASRLTPEPAAQTWTLTSTKGPTPVEITLGERGRYDVVATVIDEEGRASETSIGVWVAARTGWEPAKVACGYAVRLIADRSEYQPGDTAKILLEAPFYPAEAAVTVLRSGVVKTERITVVGPVTTLSIPIPDSSTPNIGVRVSLVGQSHRSTAGRRDPGSSRPALARGFASLSVPPSGRRLEVKATAPAMTVAPGGRARVDIAVLDAKGRAVSDAEVAIMVVDEAILSLTAHQYEDPLDPFYPLRDLGIDEELFRTGLYLPRSRPGDGTFDLECGVAGGIVGGLPPESPGAAIRVRSDFNPLAFFAPALKTDASGKVTVEFTLPDNLTHYRVVALAAAGDKQFGKGESSITARLPLMVRPSPPRFLNVGDTFELPVVVQNHTDQAVTARVAVRASNATLTEGQGREVSIPANDRAEVRFPAKADQAGTARFQIATEAGEVTDAAEVSLPVWTPATTESSATYGVIDKGTIAQPIAVPNGVSKDLGGLEVATSSTNLQSLTDAMLYLVKYPFECSEQISSRILAIAALRDVLTTFEVKGMPTPSELEARVKADLTRLESLQNEDGGFGFWRRGEESWPYLTVHVTHALVRAKEKGYRVPPDMLRRAVDYLRSIESHYGEAYSAATRRTISAYALYVRRLDGVPDLPAARRILADAGGPANLGPETNAWLLGALAGWDDAAPERDVLLRDISNRASETAGSANVTTSISEGPQLILRSDRRADAAVLEALIQAAPSSDLIPKLVTGLLAHRRAGRWSNTQDNAFVLLALDRYFRTYENITPDFVARVWVGDSFAGERAFKGRETVSQQTDVPMAWMAEHLKGGDVVIEKAGQGRLYYRIGMNYAPENLTLAAADYGFAVERTYEAIDDPGDVTQQPDGSWVIKAGARVRIRVTMATADRRYHVALVDPLPAGLEALNPELSTTGNVPVGRPVESRPASPTRSGSVWFEHQSLRDERAEAFTSLLPGGVYEYVYAARATTPGHFVVPPAKAEEMYMPETFGRSSSTHVTVK